jgi:hypothetical protein
MPQLVLQTNKLSHDEQGAADSRLEVPRSEGVLQRTATVVAQLLRFGLLHEPADE